MAIFQISCRALPGFTGQFIQINEVERRINLSLIRNFLWRIGNESSESTHDRAVRKRGDRAASRLLREHAGAKLRRSGHDFAGSAAADLLKRTQRRRGQPDYSHYLDGFGDREC